MDTNLNDRSRLEGDVLYLKVVLEGVSGFEWVKSFGEIGVRFGKFTKSVLLSEKFEPTPFCATVEIPILTGALLRKEDRVTERILAEACKRWGPTKPSPDVICSVRKNFLDGELEFFGLSRIIGLHEPIEDEEGDLSLLVAETYGVGNWIDTKPARLSYSGWNHGDGFAYNPQIILKT